jgi:hypothetical protein
MSSGAGDPQTYLSEIGDTEVQLEEPASGYLGER